MASGIVRHVTAQSQIPPEIGRRVSLTTLASSCGTYKTTFSALSTRYTLNMVKLFSQYAVITR